jgi:hypothetical protein
MFLNAEILISATGNAASTTKSQMEFMEVILVAAALVRILNIKHSIY